MASEVDEEIKMGSKRETFDSSNLALEYTAVRSDLSSLLDGGKLVRTAHCPVDFGPRDDSEVLPEFRPITKRNVCYIVASVIFNDAGEVLFMQEAKPSCHGQWYLPAGRMEPNETIVEGAKREVLEETGLEYEPETLLCVEIGDATWYRFTFTGHVTGGKLKTLADGDSESLQAKWIAPRDLRAYPLRAKDVNKLVMVAQDYQGKGPSARHPASLPVITPHRKLLMRLLIVHQVGEEVYVLLNTRETPHIISVEVNPYFTSNVFVNFTSVVKEIFGKLGGVPELDVMGVLSVEHQGKPEATNDGFAITQLLSFPKDGIMPKICPAAEKTFIWHKLEDSELRTSLRKRITPGMCVTTFF